MNDDEINRNADFLNIALDEMERENYDVAQDFVQDVYANLLEHVGDDDT